MTTTNLWGDLSTLEVVRTPKSILEEQAAVLRQATQGMLTAEVVDAGWRTVSGKHGSLLNFPFDNAKDTAKNFAYDFELVAPAMNYRYTLLTVVHDIDLYPVQLVGPAIPGSARCDDEDAFVVRVQEILSSDKTRRVLSRLLSQTQT